MKRRKAAILGATGLVGQRLVSMLADHPFLEISQLIGDESAGKSYGDSVDWKLPSPIPNGLASLEVVRLQHSNLDADLVFSALPAHVAVLAEVKLAKNGFAVVSDASAHRMDVNVPLVVPEVNPDHVRIIEAQKKAENYEGFIAANPNCSTSILSLALKPLEDAFGLSSVSVVTMQGLSGAGLPGVPSITVQDNVIPFIFKEEEKIESESRKILGREKDGRIVSARLEVSASCNRVPVSHGHLESVTLETKKPVDPENALQVLDEFKGLPQDLRLPTAPERPVITRRERDRPQPALDREAGSVPGMSIVVGRLRRGPSDHHLKFSVLGHNLIRGAAGQTILTAELLCSQGYVGA